MRSRAGYIAQICLIAAPSRGEQRGNRRQWCRYYRHSRREYWPLHARQADSDPRRTGAGGRACRVGEAVLSVPTIVLALPCNRTVRGISLLNRPKQQHHSHGDDPRQNTKAREEAEALFRPKHRVIEPSTPTDPTLAGASSRRPRVLSASVPPFGGESVRDTLKKSENATV
jgi:hypothetical protein